MRVMRMKRAKSIYSIAITRLQRHHKRVLGIEIGDYKEKKITK